MSLSTAIGNVLLLNYCCCCKSHIAWLHPVLTWLMMTQCGHSHLCAGAGHYNASLGCFPSVSNLVVTIALLFAEWNKLYIYIFKSLNCNGFLYDSVEKIRGEDSFWPVTYLHY